MLSGGGGITTDFRLHDRVANRHCPPVRWSMWLASAAQYLPCENRELLMDSMDKAVPENLDAITKLDSRDFARQKFKRAN
jgi:hypothetical protein